MNNNMTRSALVFTSCVLLTWLLGACTSQSVRIDADNHTYAMLSRIKTAVDPQFIYPLKHTKYVPADGKTLLIMGQSVEAIDEYLDAFPDQALPGGWAAYWGIPEFTGVREEKRYPHGNAQHHQMLVDRFSNAVVHSALWMVGMWNVASDTANGRYDAVLRQYAAWAKSIDRPIYLRIGYEFDGPHNALEPEVYVAAYQRIVDLFQTEGVDNIAYVWHSYASVPYKDYALSAWYPGDEYVDWVALSIFGHAYDGADMGAYAEDALAFAKAHAKPVMIAETNPINGITQKDASVWDDWFVNFFSFVYEKNIKAISFINEDWRRIAIPGIEHWGDARLYNNTEVASAWFAETNKDRYLKASPSLYRQLGYE